MTVCFRTIHDDNCNTKLVHKSGSVIIFGSDGTITLKPGNGKLKLDAKEISAQDAEIVAKYFAGDGDCNCG